MYHGGSIIYYTIYKITNKLDGKFYIGKHQTKNLDDEYFGSGKLLKRAIKKHGVKNFIKEILHVFDNEKEMNIKEKELVIISEQTYNLCEGGKGGFGYINKNKLNNKNDNGGKGRQSFKIKLKTDIEYKNSFSKKCSDALKIRYKSGAMKNAGTLGYKHTDESKTKMREKWKDPIYRQKQISSRLGKSNGPRSENTKRKIRESLCKTLELKSR